MRFFSVLFFFCFISTAFAGREISTQIYDIDMGQPHEEPLIFLSTGQVVTLPLENKSLFHDLKLAIKNKKWFLITINDEREIVSLKEIPAPPTAIQNAGIKSVLNELPYEPSILKDMNQARTLFYEARTGHHKDSQCYNRAHVWSYEWRTKRNVYSSKAWLFFTRRFIRKYQFEWWFHVAPMIHVVSDGAVRERVMDMKYSTRGPLKLKQWTDIFVRDNSHCPVVEKYSDHANFPESGSCFVMKSSMYYYQPIDLEKLETKGVKKTRWLESEVRHAYEEAFKTTLEEQTHE